MFARKISDTRTYPLSESFATKKKTSPHPFRCSKALCKRIFVPYHLLHVSLPCFTVVSRMCTLALFNHKPNLIDLFG